MSEVREGIGHLGKLIRQPDGSPVVVERSDHQYEVDQRRGERRPSRESITPRFNRSLSRGTLVEVPGDGGGFFRVSNPLPGQGKPDSIYVERISSEEFDRQQKKGTPVAVPDNLPSL